MSKSLSALISALLTGELVVPDVIECVIEAKIAVIPPEPDEEFEKLRERLGKAGKILQQKRARIH